MLGEGAAPLLGYEAIDEDGEPKNVTPNYRAFLAGVFFLNISSTGIIFHQSSTQRRVLWLPGTTYFGRLSSRGFGRAKCRNENRTERLQRIRNELH